MSRRHKAEVLEFLGIKKTSVNDRENLTAWLIDTAIPKTINFDKLLSRVDDWLFKQRLMRPTEAVLERLIRSATSQYEDKIFTNITSQISSSDKIKLDKFLTSESAKIKFSTIKADPGKIGFESVVKESDKLAFINSITLPEKTFKQMNQKALSEYRMRVASQSAWETQRHPDNIRFALTSIFLYMRKAEIIDGLVELLIQVIHRLSVRADNKVKKTLLKDFKKVYGKNHILHQIADAALEHPQGRISEVIFPLVGENTLSNLIKEYKSNGPGYKLEVHKVIRANYSSHYQRMIPKILKALPLKSNNESHKPVLDAWEFIKAKQPSRKSYFNINDDVPIDGVIQPKWHEVVIEEDKAGNKRVNRINYEICVLQSLREKLRCKEIWVEGADRFRNPDEDLPQDFSENREFYYQDLGHSQNANEFVDNLKAKMHDALTSLNESIPNNQFVRLRNTDKNRICITPLEKQPDPPNINRMKGEVQVQWPTTSLLDMLKEADMQIGFTECFQTIRSSERVDRDELQRRLILGLYGIGTNAGLKRVSAGKHGVTYKELRSTKQNYLNKYSLRQAIAMVVNATFAARDTALWGEGTTACASDSTQIGSWDQNLMAQWHARYRSSGVMIYWHVEKRSTCIYSQLKKCSSSEVASMIEGVLRHCTEMSVDKAYVDTHGQSEVGFAFSHMLGFNLMPRLKNIASQKLNVPVAGMADEFENLDLILTRSINWKIIVEQYDQIIKYTTALKQGIAEPESILRRFTRNNIQHPTYKALSELGKVIKTIFLCGYIEHVEIRREINSGLNVVENWNGANDFIFFGKSGEVASTQTDDQELSVLALHLVQQCLVYINTLMIQSVVSQDHWKDAFTDDDYRALCPLFYAHVNPYGHFDLDMETRISLGLSH
ncbi:Tn3 family transposase [Marinicella sp. X102]|nr:Tn3 family transposase [Marinicella marina]MDJ1138805.1 Tn3 family transposase [Marinicella marina]